MNVLLVCGAGASTSIVVKAMKKALKENEQDWVIEARSSSTVKEIAGKYDVVLLAPQVKFQKKMIEGICAPLGVKVMTIDARLYGACNGEKILEMVRG